MSIRELDAEVLSEMSMVDLFYHLLKEAQEPVSFHRLFEEIAELKGFEADKIHMARLFTEINIDGRFKALGDHLWGLRSWFPVEQTEEPVMSQSKKSKKKKKNVRTAEDEDIFLDDPVYDDLEAEAFEEDIFAEDEEDDLVDVDELEDNADEAYEDDLDVLDEEAEEPVDVEDGDGPDQN